MFYHFTGYGQEEVRDCFNYFDRTEHFSRFQCFAFSRNIDKYDVAQLLLSVVGDTYISYIAFEADPFVFVSVLYIPWYMTGIILASLVVLVICIRMVKQ